MAYFRQLKTGHWNAEVSVKGHRFSKTFRTKVLASQWAAKKEIELSHAPHRRNGTFLTTDDLFDNYAERVSPQKKGVKWEVIRLNSFKKHEHISNIEIYKLTPEVMAKWRDYRLKDVQAGTVLREIQLLNAVFNVAIHEWGAMVTNPLANIKRPKQPQARDYLITSDDIKTLQDKVGWNNTIAENLSEKAFICFLFACETGMRSSEILRLTKKDINGRVAKIIDSKNGHPRQVPLSTRAMELLTYLPDDSDTLFGLTDEQRDSNFRKWKNKAKLSFTFHDSRHYFTTHAAKKMPVLDLARITGHKDLSMLARYYNPTIESLADLLG